MRLTLVCIAALATGACGPADPEAEDLEPVMNEIGIDDDVEARPNLCRDLRADPSLVEQYRARGYQILRWQESGTELVGSAGPDVIFGSPGPDKIWSRGGADVVCAGGGADFVDGGLGQDRIYGEADHDVLHGRGSGDWIHGGAGDDELYGDLLDDKLFGDEGNDLLVGSHGTDFMHGGPGDDWLRGDTNGDALIGGEGQDSASFITARPTGRANKNAPTGVSVDLAAGTASGDGQDELQGIERVIGSAFDDAISGISPAAIDAGYGQGTASVSLELPFVFVDARPKDTGVVVLGSSANEDLSFDWIDHRLVVTANNGATLHAGPHCANLQTHRVRCSPPGPLRYLMAWGDDGDDKLTLGDGFPRDFTAHLDGGKGDDRLSGGDGEEVLFTGRNGWDVLRGGPGDDALISETFEDASQTPFGGGADKLFGDGGNDQLVSDYPCGGHLYQGGDGVFDIAGFARVGERRIHAELGGKAVLIDVCGSALGTTIANDLEVLEGSKAADELIGNDRGNIIWGRQGNDVIRGAGGADVLEGHEGNDTIYGGPGRDSLKGGEGSDSLHAKDGERELVLSCGKLASGDPVDPEAGECGG